MTALQKPFTLVSCGFSNQASNFLKAQGFGIPTNLLLMKKGDKNVMLKKYA